MISTGTLLEQRYEVLRLLGTGSFSRVYLARHTGLLSMHAIKVLDDQLAANPDVRNRFLAEGRIQAQLRHPNVVKVTDIVTDPVAGLVLEYIDGPTLAEFISDREGSAPSIAVVLELMLPVLSAVGAAHEQGIVHRDLKPENILLHRHEGRVVPMVGDFGIAKVVGSGLATGKARTEVGMRMGTLQYMSPEQVRGSADLDARSDIFALGAILYELVTGKVAFQQNSEFDTMKSIVEGEYVPPERVVGSLPPMFAACIRKALAVERAERFQNCESFRRTLSLALDANAPLPERPSRSAVVTQAPGILPKSAGVPAPVPVAPQVRRPAPEPPQPVIQERFTPVALEKSIAPDSNASPLTAAFLNIFCLTGIGQMYNQQVAKGLTIMVVNLFLAGLTGGGSACFIWPFALIDAWLVAAKRRDGRGVDPWECF